MKIKWIHNGRQKDISELVETITWSGSRDEACRTLEITVLNSPLDKHIPDAKIRMGDRLKLLTDKNTLLINAMVYSKELQDEQGTVTYTAYDDLRHLVNSNVRHNYKKLTPERIAKSVCKELGVQTGSIVKTNFPIKKLIADCSGYGAIMKAYAKARKHTGKKYMAIMVDRKLSVIEKGDLIDDFYLSDTKNLTSASYSQNIEDIVNVVKIYNDKGKHIGTVKNSTSLSKYGKFQTTYDKEDGVNPKKGAKAELQGMSKEASVEALGNIHCISGYAVKIHDSATGLVGKYWIQSDTHTWENGTYTMSLDLDFKNIMDTGD